MELRTAFELCFLWRINYDIVLLIFHRMNELFSDMSGLFNRLSQAAR